METVNDEYAINSYSDSIGNKFNSRFRKIARVSLKLLKFDFSNDY